MRKTSNLRTRLLALVLIMVILLPLFITTSKAFAEEKKIIVFSVEDYIDESIFDTFKEQTGIEVEYNTFATNEEMYNELIKNPKACDLMCPSEYMIMKLMSEDLIRSFETPQNFTDYGSKYIKDVFKGLQIEGLNETTIPIMSQDGATSYAVGYMWGTIGLIYNMNATLEDGTKVTPETFKSWSSIWQHFDGRVTIKDSIRDSYFIALAYVYQDELLAAKEKYALDGNSALYNATISEIFNRTDKESIDKVEKALLDLKEKLYGFEVDAGKADILTGKIDVNFAWSGDAVYSIYQGLYNEETEEVLENPVYLGYAVPEEGSNVWFDGYVMTKNANYDNAIQFLDFLCDPEIAVLNMDYTGYTSCIAGDEVFQYVVDSYNDGEGEGTDVDLAYFFDETDTTGKYVINVSDFSLPMFSAQYPTKDIIERCAVMRNFTGEELENVNNMWKRVKLITLSDAVIVLILVAIVLVIAGVVIYKYRETIFAKWYNKPPKEKKAKNKIIKKENI